MGRTELNVIDFARVRGGFVSSGTIHSRTVSPHSLREPACSSVGQDDFEFILAGICRDFHLQRRRHVDSILLWNNGLGSDHR